MRVASEDGRKLWGNVLFDKSWASISEDYYAYGWYEFMAKDPVKVKQLYTEDFFRATGSGAWIGNNLYFIMYQNFWGVDMIYTIISITQIRGRNLQKSLLTTNRS